MTNTNPVKGFKDFVGVEAKKRREVKRLIEKQFALYGFEPAETPVIEREEFVVGQNVQDSAVRDVFRLSDRGKRSLALRYEFTFQLKRISRNQKLPFKRYQIGPVFRDEPIRAGRLRQFIQCDADVVGSSVKEEAECLAMVGDVFKKLNMPITIYVNNRRLINEILVEQGIEERYREDVIRELDKLDKLSKKEVADNLKKYGAEKLVDVFTQSERAFGSYSFYAEIKALKKLCKMYGVDIEFRPYLARGLSYYNGSIFEVWSKDLGVSLCAGGAYLLDKTQAFGVSLGLEPIMLLAKIKDSEGGVQLIGNEQDGTCITLAQKLRDKGITVNVVLDKTFSKALEYANAREAGYVVIVGEKEVKTKKYTLKNMKTGREEPLSEQNLIKKLLKTLGA